MRNYDLRYETRECRCSWCWEASDDRTSHTVVSSVRGPYLELRFHHSCWLTYRGISGIEGQERGALYREWSPQRVESLHLHAGLNVEQMAARLEITKEKLIAYLSGHGELGPKPARLGARPGRSPHRGSFWPPARAPSRKKGS